MDEQEQQPQTSNGNNDESNETPETKPSKNTDNLVKDGDILPGCSTFEDFIQAAYPIVMNGVKASNALPNHQQYSYYKTYSEFEEEMKNEGKKLQDIMQMLLKYVGTKRVIHDQPQQEKFDLIVDANDKLLDRALKKMSQLDGTRFNPDDDFGEAPQEKSKKEISGSWNKNALDAAAKKGVNNDKDNESVKLIAQQKTIRPQALFKDKIDNRNIPWEPRIKEKPNALKPLDITLTVNDQGQDVYTHPYQFELDNWKPEEDRLTMVHDTYVPKEIDDTPLIFVQTEKELQLMVADLLQQREFGVDLEHHSYRSFMGFTCLMQISTKETDYLIDTLKLRDKMYILNSVFTKPNILKIFHGGGSDIDWLQRDFSVYVVNMFDTYQAAKVLEYPKLGLAFLLKQFCQVEANKKFQLYDWRTRPLPEKAKHYARQDTHYLIYIYQQMNNELFAKAGGKANLIEVVYNKSTDICKRVYVKPLLDENSYMNLYRRMQRPFDARQLFALKEIYKWRDNIARQEDESPGYVLSNHMMMQIAQTLPREVQGILACCNPIPPLVRQHAVDIHNIILQAKEVPLVKEESESEEIELSSEESVQEDETSDEDWVQSDGDVESSGESEEETERGDFIIAEAIRKRKRLEKTKPPYINIQEIVCDSSFSPTNDIIVIANSNGDLLPYSYDMKKTVSLGTIEAHTKECRFVEFSVDGRSLYSAAKDKAVVVSNLEKKEMVSFYEDSHPADVSAMTVITENLLCTGDESGNLKLWDLRVKNSCIQNTVGDINDYVSSILTREHSDYISCTSGEGVMTIYDMRKLTIFSQSEHHKSDLTCSALTHQESEIVCGSLTGDMLMYKWAGTAEPLGKYDPMPNTALNCMLAVSENIIVTGWEDKIIRAYHLYPNQEIGIVGQHELPVEGLELSRDGSLVASTSLDQRLKFWNIKYLEDYDALPKSKKKPVGGKNLPSSNVEDRGNFFSELARPVNKPGPKSSKKY